jgi:DNA-3-methyladenine glycosylase
MKLPLSFYQRKNVVSIAKDLLGKVLVTNVNDTLTSGIIVETEAYSEIERGCHAFNGRTQRNGVMFSEGGISYVYLCYGIHHLFNVVTNERDRADAVLVRALEPLMGAEAMMKRMNVKTIKRISSGPGKLTKALGIDRSLNGLSLHSSNVWIEEGNTKISKTRIVSSPRIGIDYAGTDALLPWRFCIKDNLWVSK